MLGPSARKRNRATEDAADSRRPHHRKRNGGVIFVEDMTNSCHFCPCWADAQRPWKMTSFHNNSQGNSSKWRDAAGENMKSPMLNFWFANKRVRGL